MAVSQPVSNRSSRWCFGVKTDMVEPAFDIDIREPSKGGKADLLHVWCGIRNTARPNK